jgi:hypothetical protein
LHGAERVRLEGVVHVLSDDEHCAVDEGKSIDPSRKRLIKRESAALSKIERRGGTT